MGLVHYISRNPFARAKNISTYDKHFVVGTISKIRDSMKHLITNKQNAIKKFKGILKSHLPSHKLKRPLAPQLPTLLNTNSHIHQHFKHPFASQMPLKFTKLQFAPNNCKVNNSHSINKFAAKEVQMSDSKECEHSEHLSPTKPINGIKSNNPPNNAKFSAKAQIPKYKDHLNKNHPLFPKFNLHITPQ